LRLITLTGPGGVGKTSLALRVAHEAQDSFADGAFFISLAPISDPTLIVPTIAQTLRLPESPHRLWLDSLEQRTEWTLVQKMSNPPARAEQAKRRACHGRCRSIEVLRHLSEQSASPDEPVYWPRTRADRGQRVARDEPPAHPHWRWRQRQNPPCPSGRNRPPGAVRAWCLVGGVGSALRSVARAAGRRLSSRHP